MSIEEAFRHQEQKKASRREANKLRRAAQGAGESETQGAGVSRPVTRRKDGCPLPSALPLLHPMTAEPLALGALDP